MHPGLYDYQKAGAAWLAVRRFGLLADEAGLGKSAQAVTAADLLRADNVLVVCPGILRINWTREFQKFSSRDLPASILNPSDLSALPSSGVVVASYDSTLKPEVRRFLHSRRWDVVILDEAHMLKEPESQRTIAAYGRYADGSGYIAPSAFCWRLTATPTPNNPSEIYTYVRSTGLWQAGQALFVERFCKTRQSVYGVKITGSRNEEELRAALAPHVLRRTLDDVGIQLPPLRLGEIFVAAQEVDPSVLVLDELKLSEPEAARRIAKAIKDDDWTFEDDPYIARVRRLVGLAKVRSIAQQIEFELENHQIPKIVVIGIHREFLKYLSLAIRSSAVKYIWAILFQ